MFKSNLIILCVDKKFKSLIAKKLARMLDMNFVEADEIVDYELVDAKKMIEKAGLEYFECQRNRIIKRIFTFENSVISIDKELLGSVSIKKMKDSGNFIFLKLLMNVFDLLQKKSRIAKDLRIINSNVFNERQQYLEKYGDIIIEIDNIDVKNVIESIINELKKYYLINKGE